MNTLYMWDNRWNTSRNDHRNQKTPEVSNDKRCRLIGVFLDLGVISRTAISTSGCTKILLVVFNGLHEPSIVTCVSRVIMWVSMLMSRALSLYRSSPKRAPVVAISINLLSWKFENKFVCIYVMPGARGTPVAPSGTSGTSRSLSLPMEPAGAFRYLWNQQEPREPREPAGYMYTGRSS